MSKVFIGFSKSYKGAAILLTLLLLLPLFPSAALSARFCDSKEMALLDVDGPESALTGDFGPYLQNVGSRSALIEWNRREPKGGSIEITEGVKKHRLAYSASKHSVVGLCDLKPESLYTYRLEGENVYSFRTLPEAKEASFRFAAVGDSGTAGPAQKAVFDQIAKFNPLFIVMTGDLAYPEGSYVDYQENFLKPLEAVLAAFPVFPSLGNHDKKNDSKAYLDLFSLPHNNEEKSERYYSFDAGPLHVSVLDSSRRRYLRSLESVQLKWLDSDLGATKKPWKVVVFHHPPYASGIFHADDLQIREAIEPLLAKHRVDLVLNGHHHSYQRSYPQMGVVYIVTGGGGGTVRSIFFKRFFTEKAVPSRHHFVGFEVSEKKISLTAIDRRGRVIDTWEKTRD